MLPQVHWLCYTLLWVSLHRLNAIEDMSTFRTYASEQQCEKEVTFVEFKSYGIMQCFRQCLQFASCTHVRYHPKEMICRISKTLPPGKPKISKSDQGWTCWKITHLVACPDCQRETRCIKTRSDQTKCVPYDVQDAPKETVRMLTQVDKVIELFNTTPQALDGKWTTTKSSRLMKSMTWSPLSSDDFYCLIYVWLGNSIERFTFKGNKLEAQSGSIRVADNSFIPILVDTGRCQKDDRMACLHVFGSVYVPSYRVLHMRSYRVMSPRQLVVERQEDITQRGMPIPLCDKCAFASNWKLGMALYRPQGERSAMKKYAIQAGEGAFSLNEVGDVEGLKDILHFKWNNDGTFGFAMSATTFYLINAMEHVLIEVQHKWDGEFRPVCTNTSILVQQNIKGNVFLHVLKF